MKSKISSFLMSILTTSVMGVLIFLVIILYNEFSSIPIVDEVEEFVSNVTITSEATREKIEVPKIIESKITALESEENKKDISAYKISHLNKYFYNQLDDYSKIIYSALNENKENMKTGNYRIELGTEFSEVLSQSNGTEQLGDYYQSAIEAYSYDNPDIFYIDFSKLYINIETTTIGTKSTYKVFINSREGEKYLKNDFNSKQQIDSYLNQMEAIKLYFVQNKKDDTYLNIKMIHDYLIESIEYDETISQSNIYNIYGALINKKCVCEGYAKSFKYLIDALDIPCVIVIGKGTNSEGITENHAWNCVQIKENWYAIDCTWDDPIIIGGSFLTDGMKYKYFLKGEIEFRKTHTPIGQFTENGKEFSFPILSTKNYEI